jgi:hypothetical protein
MAVDGGIISPLGPGNVKKLSSNRDSAIDLPDPQ